MLISDDPSNLRMANPPYGETFFHHPNAEHYGLPFMPPSASVAGNGSSIEGGVNFAVAGTNTVDSAFYEARGIVNTYTNASLNVQMIWFKDVLPLLCATPSAPDGCLPVILTNFASANGLDYDPNTGCLSWMNELNELHNLRLQQRLNIIRHLNPDVVIIYADLYNAAMKLYRFVQSLAACCGTGGAYRYSDNVRCGDIELINSCPDPWRHIDWDGCHMSEKANKLITMTLLDGTYTSPPINTLCASSSKFTYYD
nr:GDSL esterase/lipase At1g28580-like [Ipomoea batatas]